MVFQRNHDVLGGLALCTMCSFSRPQEYALLVSPTLLLCVPEGDKRQGWVELSKQAELTLSVRRPLTVGAGGDIRAACYCSRNQLTQSSWHGNTLHPLGGEMECKF